MKTQIKKIILKMSTWPMVGRFIRFPLNMFRIYRRSAHSNFGYNQYVLETQQLPKLLSIVSELKHQQLSRNQGEDNLLQSIPVTLRQITRDAIAMQNELKLQSETINVLTEQIRVLEKIVLAKEKT